MKHAESPIHAGYRLIITRLYDKSVPIEQRRQEYEELTSSLEEAADELFPEQESDLDIGAIGW